MSSTRRPRARPLSAAQITKARRAHDRGEPLRSIADRLDCHFSTVSKALSRSSPTTALARRKPAGKVEVVRDDSPITTPPPRVEHRDLPLYDNRLWETVGAVRSALTQLNEGEFEAAALMVDAMLADDRVSGVWSCRADGLTALPLDMRVPLGLEKDARAKAIAEDAERLWQNMAPESAIAELLKWGRFLGVGLAEKVYAEGSWVPRLKVWHPRFIRWNKDKRCFSVLTADSSFLDLDPTDINVRRKWVFYCPYGMDRGWMNGRVRPLSIPWLTHGFTWRDHNRYNEVMGLMIRKVKVPQTWDPTEVKRALSELARLASESVVRCPVDEAGKGFDVELLEAKNNGWENFTSLASRAEVAIAVVLLGQNLTTEVGDKGSRAAAQVHERVRQDVIQSDSETLSTCLHDQVMGDWAEFVYGDRNLAPWPTWDIVPPRDAMQEGTALRAVAEAFLTFRKAKLKVDYHKMAERYGVPLLIEEGEAVEDWEDPTVEVAKIKASAVVSAAEAKPAPAALPPRKIAASLAALDVPAGALRGQLYSDALRDDAAKKAGEMLSPFVARLLAVMGEAKSYEEIRVKVLEAFRDEAKPEEMATLLEHAMVLAGLNGMLSAREDDPQPAAEGT